MSLLRSAPESQYLYTIAEDMTYINQRPASLLLQFHRKVRLRVKVAAVPMESIASAHDALRIT